MSAVEEAVASDLTAGSPLWAWAHEAIGQRARTMLEHAEGVREGEDIEHVHQMRVASRRLVAAMRVFSCCFPDRKYQRLLREARQVTRALGEVRDLDVLIDHYERLRPEVEETPGGPEARLGIDYVLALLARKRRIARKPMLASLEAVVESDFPSRVVKHLRREAEAYQVGLGPDAVAGAHEPDAPDCNAAFREAAPRFIRDRVDELYRWEPYVHRPDVETELHEMRIAAKWLRYTLELFAPAYPDALKDAVSQTRKLQELLGDLHDSDVRRFLLREMLEAPLDVDGLEPIGQLSPDPVVAGLKRLLAREDTVRAGCYSAFYKEWKKQQKRGFHAAALGS